MAANPAEKKNAISPDWLVRGVLTKLGDAVDRFTGRGWKPSSSLATSELIERLKLLVDAESRTSADGRVFVPHNIKLKMQWDKFSTDAEEALRKLETELLTALIDHINDRRYYTYAPIALAVKPDYFTDGVKLSVSFDSLTEDDAERSVDVQLPVAGEAGAAVKDHVESGEYSLALQFALNGNVIEKQFSMKDGDRLSVGRAKANDIFIDDASVSKSHGSIAINSSGELLLADTGSTNGTFLNGERIAYGKAILVSPADKITFGSIDVALELSAWEPAPALTEAATGGESAAESYEVDGFEFRSKSPIDEAPLENTGQETIQMPRMSRILTPIATSPHAEPKVEPDGGAGEN